MTRTSVDQIDPQAVALAMDDGAGRWLSCTGCHEHSEGVPNGPYSPTLKCHLGMGCTECGGIGAIWDDTDWSEFGMDPQPAPVEPDALVSTPEPLRAFGGDVTHHADGRVTGYNWHDTPEGRVVQRVDQTPPEDVGALYADLVMAAGIWALHATAEKCPTFSRGDARHFADLFQRAAALAKQGSPA